MIKTITTKNAAYQKFEVLKTNRNKRYRYNEFFIEGVRNINQAISNNWNIVSFIYSFEKKISDWGIETIKNIKTQINYELSDALMKEISDKEDTSELLAIAKMRNNEDNPVVLSDNPVIALFDRPSNKGNLGTLLRSCDALGVEGLIITGHAVDVYDREVISSSMGSFFKVPFIKMSDNLKIDLYINTLKEKYPKLKIIGTTAHRQTNISAVDLSEPTMFLIGNETDGLNQHLSEISDIMVTIPMSENSSASSLNVGCAATVLFYEACRQRGFN